MIRLACAVLSAVLFGLFSSTSAGATSQVEMATIIAYNYDDIQHTAPMADATSERGPPSTDDRTTGSDAVDLWSGGAWSRSETEAPAPTTTYTTWVHPAHAAADAVTAETHVRVTSRELRARSDASVAANSGAPLIKAGAEGGESAGKAFSQRVRQQALDENPSTCVYCRMETGRPQVDHVIPRSRGGNATLPNAQTTCPWCNASKGARDFPVNPPPGFEGMWPPSWWWLP